MEGGEGEQVYVHRFSIFFVLYFILFYIVFGVCFFPPPPPLQMLKTMSGSLIYCLFLSSGVIGKLMQFCFMFM